MIKRPTTTNTFQIMTTKALMAAKTDVAAADIANICEYIDDETAYAVRGKKPLLSTFIIGRFSAYTNRFLEIIRSTKYVPKTASSPFTNLPTSGS